MIEAYVWDAWDRKIPGLPTIPDSTDRGEATPRAAGTVFEVYVDTGKSPGRWRCIDAVRATTAKAAYQLARDRNSAHHGVAMRVEGPGGCEEGVR